MSITLRLYELPGDLFSRCKPLYANAPFDLPAYNAVFEGVQPGRIFVDNPDAPTSALMCRTYEYYIAGMPAPSLRTFIKDAPQEPGVFQHLYGCTPIGEAWTNALFEDAPLHWVGRRNFQWDMNRPAPDFPAPEGSRIERVNLALAEQIDRELFLPFLQMSWGSREALVENGFAYCIMQGGSVASTIYSIANSKTGVIVGIDTIERFQRQGYGVAVSTAFIHEALQRGMQPIWDTDDDNLRSVALALKLGFVEHEPYKELFPPDRKPQLSQGIWSKGETRSDGVTKWRRN